MGVISMKNILHIPKFMDVIIGIGDNLKTNIYQVSIARKVQYSYTFNVVKELEKRQLVIRSKKGRNNVLEFTEDGKKLYSAIKIIDEMLEVKHGKSNSDENIRMGNGSPVREPQRVMQEHPRSYMDDEHNGSEQEESNGDGDESRDGNGFHSSEGDSKYPDNR